MVDGIDTGAYQRGVDPNSPDDGEGGSDGSDGSEPAVYHVDPDGSDNAEGSADAPWRTLEHAIGQLTPGDTLRLAAGTYAPSRPLRLPDGDAGERIEIVGDPDDPARVTIDAANVQAHDGDGYGWPDGLVLGWYTGLSGVRVANAPNQGIATFGDVAIAHCIVDGNEANGIRTSRDNVGINRCTSYNNGAAGYYATGDNRLADCIADANGEGPTEFGNGTETTACTWTLGIDEPGFVSTDPASEEYLRLAEGSACIGAGTDGRDLGAYDHDTGDTEHELILSSSNEGADYDFRLSEGEILEADNGISDDRLRTTGTVWEGFTDPITFVGTPESLTGDDWLTAELNGKAIDPSNIRREFDGSDDGGSTGDESSGSGDGGSDSGDEEAGQYTQADLDAAREAGYDNGYDDGYAAGKTEGYDAGYADGTADARVTVWNNALDAVREGLPDERPTDGNE